ncbi:T9SS type A sorting domain-containing protein [Adhaeribacter sp. BT258]|uniref:T9SS type A sorting domain-containing protein n=1 Tax=Adhaeribacter terrigena TaxID=2793070 RepID=A0ABS1C4Q3_9BACT|nr:T9SS type A sorting domain-containing protein [Adhaeribacter terrigena]MBK0404380.1 T9SS type A sorting domain-containing protein [Adhaeribacter terrigena]
MNKFTPLFLLCVFLLFGRSGQAQSPITIGTGTSASGANVLFSTNTGSNLWSKSASLYTAAEIIAAGGSAGNIFKIAWNKQGSGEYTHGNAHLNIYIKAVTKTTQAGASLDFHTNRGNAILVYSSTTHSFMTGTGWNEIHLQTPFLWDGTSNLEVITAFHHPTTLTANMTWQYTVATDMNMSRVNSTELGSQTMFLQSNRPNIQFTITPNTPCTTPPTPGTATASVTSICSNTNFNLNVAGTSYGLGQTYQWEKSATGTAPWTPVGTPAAIPYFTTSQTSTNFYRLAVTCSGQTAYTNSVQVYTNPTPLAGTYTIDKNSASTTTNFTSFQALIEELACRGISAPVTVNVATGSGPYNEQIILTNITGISATNTLTFNGNGNKIAFAPSSANRAVVQLDGMDHTTFNNFKIEATDATYGWGFHLLNGADNNTISNNTITITSTSTTEASTGGIIFSNSLTSVTVAGNTGNNNVISGNTIVGGYKGIHVNSVVTTASNNQIINNTIKDFYADGIKINAAKGTLVEGNDISRPTRATTTTFTGIELGDNSQLTVVSKNRIHNVAGGDLTPTSVSYGINTTSADAPAGSENVYKNNLIYNFNSTGTIYGIYNSNSDGSHYYHNTIDLDNASNTGSVRGFHQTAAASNIRFINNVINLNAGATGTKHALYFNTTTSAITSNNNVLYIAPGLSNAHTGYYSGNKTTLVDWKTANSNAFDQASIAADPVFINAAGGNLRPNAAALDNTGQALPAVTTDITGATRSTTTPDPGAFEFTIPANDVAVTNISGPVSGCNLTTAEAITITLRNFGSATQTSIPVNYKVNGTTIGTGTWTGTLAPNATATYLFTQTANLATSGAYVITAQATLATDANPANDTLSATIGNALLTNMPIVFDFETTANGTGALRVITKSNSNITEGAAASNGSGSANGMIMEGVSSTQWATPAGTVNPWTNNPDHFSAVYFCFTPNTAPQDTLFLTFNLKQLYKDSHLNTNFRVTVNGKQEGPTYTPPFGGYDSLGATWDTIQINLEQYKHLGSIEIGLESSVKEEFANGNGTANLIDNIEIFKVAGPTGVKENILQSNVVVFPNPSTGLFNLKVPATTRNYSVEVMDLTGKLVKQQTVTNNAGTSQLNLNGTAKGIYILKIASEGNVATRKLIVE